MIFDIVTPAMPRPDILDKTYRSFTDNIEGVDWDICTCYINVDLFPCERKELEKTNDLRMECIEVAHNYFGTVVPRLPVYETDGMYHGHFTEAFNWLFKSATSDYVLCLEDDWVLTEKIDVQDLLSPFGGSETMYEVVLRAYTYKYPCVCMSPSIFHKRFYRSIAGHYDTLRNPECQVHSRTDLPIFLPNRGNCDKPEKYVVAYPDHVIVKDIGREWLDKSPYCRPQTLAPNDPRYKKKNNYTHWIKK